MKHATFTATLAILVTLICVAAVPTPPSRITPAPLRHPIKLITGTIELSTPTRFSISASPVRCHDGENAMPPRPLHNVSDCLAKIEAHEIYIVDWVYDRYDCYTDFKSTKCHTEDGFQVLRNGNPNGTVLHSNVYPKQAREWIFDRSTCQRTAARALLYYPSRCDGDDGAAEDDLLRPEQRSLHLHRALSSV